MNPVFADTFSGPLEGEKICGFELCRVWIGDLVRL